MTTDTGSAHDVLAEQFRIIAQISALTGEYHRLLQKVAAAAFARQMAEDRGDVALAEAEQAEAAAKLTAEACEQQVNDLEEYLSALARKLAALK